MPGNENLNNESSNQGADNKTNISSKSGALKEAYSGYREASNTSKQDKKKRGEPSSSSKKAGKTAAKAAANYFAPGVGGAAVDLASKTKLGNAYLNQVGKYIDKQPGFAKALKKADDIGALDKADKAVDMLGSKGASGAAESGASKIGAKEGMDLAGSAMDKKNKKANDSANQKEDATPKSNPLNNLNPLNNIGSEMSVSGFFLKHKTISFALIGGIALLFMLILISAVIASESSDSVNDGLGVSEGDAERENIKYEASSKSAQAFYERVKEVRNEYMSNGKNFDPVLVAAFLKVVHKNTSDRDYDNMTKGKIEEVVDAMFTEDSTAYDKEIFKKNLKDKLLPKYAPGKGEQYNRLIKDIFIYVDNYRSIFGENSTLGSGNYGEKILDVAISQLDDSNTSKHHGEKYWKYMGFSSYVYWCASFVSWCADQAGLDQSIVPKSAAVNTYYDYYTKAGLFHKIDSGYIPQPGDLIIWKSGQNAKGWSHIGIVEKYDKSTDSLYTIEGNSSDSVARNIYKNLGGCTGFASPNYPVINDEPVTTIKAGTSINIPSGLGTYGTREFDLADTNEEISYSRYIMSTYGRITNPYAFPESSTQRKVQNMWIAAGAKHDKSGFCKLQGRYLIAVTTTYGTIGDKVDFYLSNGKIIHGIIGDAKNQSDDKCTKWGHQYGQVVLEFMGTNNIGNNPYDALGIKGVTTTKAVNGGSIF